MEVKSVLSGIVFSILIVLFALPFANAAAGLDYEITYVNPSAPEYEDGIANIKFRITQTDSVCTYDCRWQETAGGDSGPFELSPDESTYSKTFSVPAIPGQGTVEGLFKVTCERVFMAWPPCLGGDETPKTKEFDFSYDYNGDNKCQDNKESCATSSDCLCNSYERCEGSGLSAKCSTYCGNDRCDSDEDCTCSQDCGKCDGVACSRGSECEGKYCVSGKCSSKPYIVADGICTASGGENCKVSPVDCKCDPSERCSNEGSCETYCGNDICEESEKGICKLDCSWCGDGECSGADNCKNCPEDCGKCKEAVKNIAVNLVEKEEKISSPTGAATIPIKTSGDSTGSDEITLTKKTLFTGIACIILTILIIFIIIYLVIKKKK